MSCNLAFACALGSMEHCDVLWDLCIMYFVFVLIESLSEIGLYSTIHFEANRFFKSSVYNPIACLMKRCCYSFQLVIGSTELDSGSMENKECLTMHLVFDPNGRNLVRMHKQSCCWIAFKSRLKNHPMATI